MSNLSSQRESTSHPSLPLDFFVAAGMAASDSYLLAHGESEKDSYPWPSKAFISLKPLVKRLA